MALESTQPPTEMSNRNLPWVQRAAAGVCKADLTASTSHSSMVLYGCYKDISTFLSFTP
jgi:hypothetical protein